AVRGAPGVHLATRDACLAHIYARPRKIEMRVFDLHLRKERIGRLAPTGANAKIGDIDVGDLEIQRDAGGGRREIVLPREPDHAARDLESERFLQIRPDGAGLHLRQLESPAGGERLQTERAAPREALAGARRTLQRVGVTGLLGRAEITEVERDRLQLRAEGSGAR